MNKKVHILGGGTLAYVRPHLALCAPGPTHHKAPTFFVAS
jgi:hypothetical protein